MDKYTYLLILFIIIVLILIPKKMGNSLTNIVNDFKIRKDSLGDGSYLSSRGSRKHMGIDVRVNENENIRAPFDLEYLRLAKPYKNDNLYYGALYKHKNGFIKIFYFVPITNIKYFKKGEIIGQAQNISNKYGSGMYNHIHIESFDLSMNNIDPTLLF